jgi:cytochrome b pre-mRNA-processing protein 3
MLARLARLLVSSAPDPALADLYRAIVAAARREAFYRDMGAPDTVDGRFDMLLLHMNLAMRRLDGHAAARQALFDLLFSDMDRSLREMGVGDMGLGKKMKPMLAAFYGQARAYEEALAAGDEALGDVLRRNLYRKGDAAPDVLALMVDYVRRAVAALDGQSVGALLSGRIEFATPSA